MYCLSKADLSQLNYSVKNVEKNISILIKNYSNIFKKNIDFLQKNVSVKFNVK